MLGELALFHCSLFLRACLNEGVGLSLVRRNREVGGSGANTW